MGWNIQLPDAEYYHLQSPDLDGVVREVADQRSVAIDTETDGLSIIRCKPYYWSLSWTSQNGKDRRLTLNADAFPAFKRVFDDIERSWVFVNAKFDAHMMYNGGFPIKGKLVDVSVMHALLYEEEPHGLKDMARVHLGWKWTDFSDTFGKVRARTCVCGGTEASHGPQGNFCKKTGCMRFQQVTSLDVLRKAERENPDLLVDYAANDAFGTWKLKQLFDKELAEAKTHSLYTDSWPYIHTMYDYFYKTEVPFTRVLWTCEHNGLKVDKSYLEGISPNIVTSMEQLRFEINRLTGRIMKTAGPGLVKYFIDECRLTPHKMTKGGKSGVKKPSIDAKYLGWVADEYPDEDFGKVAKLLLEHGAISKQYSTYIEDMPGRLDAYDYVHMKLNQDVARCMPAGELVLTNRGYLPVETVKVGDLVLSHTGKPRKVIKVSEHNPQPIYRVRLQNGLILRTNGSHPYRSGDSWVRADCLGRVAYSHMVTVHSGRPEQWKKIPGWPNYKVSSWGRVLNTKTRHLLAQQPKGEWGHLKVTLARNCAQQRGADKKDFAVHQLVSLCFHGRRPPNKEIRHLDGVAWNNTEDNLSYGTSKENTSDSRAHGTLNGAPILTPDQVKEIRAAHRLGQPASSTAKLSYNIAEKVRELHASGNTLTALAKKFNVTIQAVSHIVNNKTWTRPKGGISAEVLGIRYGVSAACIRDIWAGRRWNRSTPATTTAFFTTSPVVDVVVEEPEATYGLSVEIDHSHVTGGIVTHNTGRLSSSDPNMQNVTTGEKDRFHLRNAFICEPDEDVVVADYSQLEMRLLAAASQEPAMMEIFHKNWDIHTGNAVLMYGIPYEEIVETTAIAKQVKKGKLPESALTARIWECLNARSDVKNIGFGLNYGMKAKAMAARMGCTVEEAEEKIKRYMDTYPAVRAYFDASIQEVRDCGYAFTLMGRRRSLPDIWARRDFQRFRAERQASNLPIQGTAAEACKMAMTNIYEDGELEKKYGYKMRLQVHDEILGTCPKECTDIVKERIKEWMEHPFPSDIGVPLTIDIGSASSWGGAK